MYPYNMLQNRRHRDFNRITKKKKNVKRYYCTNGKNIVVIRVSCMELFFVLRRKKNEGRYILNAIKMKNEV